MEFGDLTVLVGPQASGKSILLQLLKLMVDGPRIVSDLKRYGYEWEGDLGGGKTGSIFPRGGRLKSELRKAIDDAVFHGFSLRLDRVGGIQKRLVLKGAGDVLPFMVWSAGQREFVPLLLGLYWLCPAARIPRRDTAEWVVVEEPEMGLHPQAISAVMLVVLELLWRGYRVVLSTHSPHVLDVVWGIRTLQENGASRDGVIDMFGLRRHSSEMRKIADAALTKAYRVFYFDRSAGTAGHVVRDISALDPGADDPREAGWGGLTEFSGRVGEVIANAVANREQAGPQ